MFANRLELIGQYYCWLQFMIRRHFQTKKFYREALQLSKAKDKKLMIIGDPCRGTYFRFVSKYFPNCEHGDITVDLYGCSDCNRMNINDMKAWSKFDTNSYVVMETGTISYSEDIEQLLKEIKRISGGDFLSSGSTQGYLWEYFLYKTYDKNLNYVTYPFDYRKDTFHSSKTLVEGKKVDTDFKEI